MATAGLEAVPEVSEIRLACPNKHYIRVDLSPFGLVNKNQVFLPTDEPHGQIECQVGRGWSHHPRRETLDELNALDEPGFVSGTRRHLRDVPWVAAGAARSGPSPPSAVCTTA